MSTDRQALPDPSNTVVLRFEHSRAAEGTDVASILRNHLGPEADITADMGEDGSVCGYALTMRFPSPEAAFDAALAVRNFMASEGWPCRID